MVCIGGKGHGPTTESISVRMIDDVKDWSFLDLQHSTYINKSTFFINFAPACTKIVKICYVALARTMEASRRCTHAISG